jgi:ubiquinone/menaquinone biosynthesis C-methylase UbiE
MHEHVALIGTAYDRLAPDYEAQWSVHVQEPQQRLTEQLSLSRGERCADLGCGTGADTLEMLRRVAPGEVWAVDCSTAMLESARRRAHAAGFDLLTRCQGADEFIAGCEDAAFDVMSVRFCLGYMDWATALPRLPRLLRRGGRIGILTILASSAPQAYATYRQMSAEHGVSEVPLSALASLDQIEANLRLGGANMRAAWTHSFRLWFGSGAALAAWLQASGIATSPLLAALPAPVRELLWAAFASRIESLREPAGIPLDFDLAGAIAG